MTQRHLAALLAALTAATAAVVAQPVRADQFASEAAPSRTISVPKDKSLSFRLDEPATKIVVAQPDIAEVVATTDRSFYVRGLDVGATNLLVYGPGGRLMQVIDVRVGVDAQLLQADIAQALPNERIQVRTIGDGVLLTGKVSNAGVALRAKAIAEKAAPDQVVSMLDVAGSQVVLEVRVLEATRATAQDLGVGLEFGNQSFVGQQGANVVGHPIIPPGGQFPLVGLLGTTPPIGAVNIVGAIGHTAIDAQLAALETKGMIRTLARPNLVAMSGEKASFLAGGEFPFPIPSGLGQISIEFRQYGVKLDFTPTVEDDGKIKLLVAPEVSALDPTNTVRIDNVTVPALTVRRANTTVELRDGESLAIGGMFQHTAQTDISQIPGLGNIPILSALFRSTRYQRNETELLIIVTPKLVTQGDIDSAKDRTIAGVEPGMAGFLLNGNALDKPLARDLKGPVDDPSRGRAAAPAAVAAAPIAKPATLALRGEIPPPPIQAAAAPAAVAVSAPVPAPAPVVTQALAPVQAPVQAAQAAPEPAQAAPEPAKATGEAATEVATAPAAADSPIQTQTEVPAPGK
ncbi:type II and III secretion system protein family protein [Phenylobacterium sp.]|uniref:type II and III secretion system protein family protein n=1 Tax=Phenylobacterium sp. TaxID=1871053 RepID=UPI002F40AB1E